MKKCCQLTEAVELYKNRLHFHIYQTLEYKTGLCNFYKQGGIELEYQSQNDCEFDFSELEEVRSFLLGNDCKEIKNRKGVELNPDQLIYVWAFIPHSYKS